MLVTEKVRVMEYRYLLLDLKVVAKHGGEATL
jgi:hypothetical protein